MAVRRDELLADPSLIAKTYDAEHLCAIHRHLFQDVYEWAGQLRTIDLGKTDAQNQPLIFARIGEEVDFELFMAGEVARGTDWLELDRERFATKAAEVYAHLNYARPFRDGNELAAQIFMDHVAEQTNFALDFAHVDSDRWGQALLASLPQRQGEPVRSGRLTDMFRLMTVTRPEVVESEFGGLTDMFRLMNIEPKMTESEAAADAHIRLVASYPGVGPAHEQETTRSSTCTSSHPAKRARVHNPKDPGVGR